MEEERTNKIQDNKINDNNEKKGRGLFYFVIAFAVIIIAIVGATYAYFTASTTTNEENSITTGSTSLDLGIETDDTGANYDLIPTADAIAKYAYAEQKEITYEDPQKCVTYKKGADGNPTEECLVYKKEANSTCIDDSGAAVCSTYSYTVKNDNINPQTLTMYLGTTENLFKNLYFAVYVEESTDDGEGTTRTRITDPKAVETETAKEVKMEIRTDIETTDYERFNNLVHPTLTKENPTRKFTIVLWIKEDGTDQTETDGNGKTFKGYVRVTSGDGHGVTGAIGEAVTSSGVVIYDDSLKKTTETTTSTTTETITSTTTETSTTE